MALRLLGRTWLVGHGVRGVGGMLEGNANWLTNSDQFNNRIYIPLNPRISCALRLCSISVLTLNADMVVKSML